MKQIAFCLLGLLFSFNGFSQEQEIELDSLYNLYDRLNSNNLQEGDIQTLEYINQTYYRDSLSIHKTFTDKNGKNKLEIKIINPCMPDLEHFDGIINRISIQLNNQHYSDTLIYYNPHVLMSLIHLESKNITMRPISNKQAVFIPFSYCGNADDNIQIAYIILFDHKKYLFHIDLVGENFENYRLNDNLNKKLDSLPKRLKEVAIRQIKSQCAKIAQ